MSGAPSVLLHPPSNSEFKRQVDYLASDTKSTIAALRASDCAVTRALADALHDLSETRVWKLPLNVARDHRVAPMLAKEHGDEAVQALRQFAPSVLDEFTKNYCALAERKATTAERSASAEPKDVFHRQTLVFLALQRTRREHPGKPKNFAYTETARRLGFVNPGRDGKRKPQRGVVGYAEKKFMQSVNASGPLLGVILQYMADLTNILEEREASKKKSSNVTRLDRAGIEQKRSAT